MPDFQVVHADCLEFMPQLRAECVDAIVSDPPYGLGFMGKQWDHGVPGVPFWIEALRVLKPGGYLVAFGGTRTYHRLACAIEDAGFELRDCMQWLYGSGFPKSHNLKGDHAGFGTALKPAYEPIVLARKPFKGTVAANVLEHGVGALNIDGCRIAHGTDVDLSAQQNCQTEQDGAIVTLNMPGHSQPTYAPGGRWPANVILDPEAAAALDAQTGALKNGGPNKRGKRHQGVATENPTTSGETAFAGDSGGASRFFYCAKASKGEREAGLEDFTPITVGDGRETPADNAYQRGKTLRKNTHTTVKPIELMRYLCRLVTPPGGLVLDPFCGSGTTGCAAVLEGFNFVGVEREAEYVPLAEARIAHWLAAAA